MTADSHDTLVIRLAQMLVKLNQGERLDPKALAEEFGVNLRTIQRDLKVRFAYLPLEKESGRYFLHPSFLGKLSTKDIHRFAGLAGVKGLFPSLSDDFLREIFDDRLQGALLVKGHHYEDLSGKESVFRAIENAILEHRQLAFEYEKAEGVKVYQAVSPYRLVNNKGIWYLAAVDDGRLKTFSFAKMQRVSVLDSCFVPSEQIAQTIREDDGAWLGEEKSEVVLKISREVSGYFKRRKLIANQVIEKELADGGLLVSARVGHRNQVIPIVRYWVPHIRIISPEGWQDELDQGLLSYLERQKLTVG